MVFVGNGPGLSGPRRRGRPPRDHLMANADAMTVRRSAEVQQRKQKQGSHVPEDNLILLVGWTCGTKLGYSGERFFFFDLFPILPLRLLLPRLGRLFPYVDI